MGSLGQIIDQAWGLPSLQLTKTRGKMERVNGKVRR